MSRDEHFRKLERMYASAPCNEYYSPTLAVTRGRTELTVAVQRKFHHAAGAVHGALYFKMLDDAAFFAVNSLVEDVFVLTVSFGVHFLRPVASGKLKAVGRVVSPAKSLFVAESVLYNDKGKEVARGSGSFIRSSVPLDPKVGYR